GATGAITVSNAGNISTSGATAHGIFVTVLGGDGVGGAGGSGGDGFGGFGGGGGSGRGGDTGVTTVTNSGSITTSGAGSHGILVTTQGGSGLGGAAGFGGFGGSGGAGGNGGNAGTIQVTNSGAITTFGDGSHGVMATSTGGIGG